MTRSMESELSHFKGTMLYMYPSYVWYTVDVWFTVHSIIDKLQEKKGLRQVSVEEKKCDQKVLKMVIGSNPEFKTMNHLYRHALLGH